MTKHRLELDDPAVNLAIEGETQVTNRGRGFFGGQKTLKVGSIIPVELARVDERTTPHIWLVDVQNPVGPRPFDLGPVGLTSPLGLPYSNPTTPGYRYPGIRSPNFGAAPDEFPITNFRLELGIGRNSWTELMPFDLYTGFGRKTVFGSSVRLLATASVPTLHGTSLVPSLPAGFEYLVRGEISPCDSSDLFQRKPVNQIVDFRHVHQAAAIEQTFANNGYKQGMFIDNKSDSNLYIQYLRDNTTTFGFDTTTTNYTVKIDPGWLWEMPEPFWDGAIAGIWEEPGAGFANVTVFA